MFVLFSVGVLDWQTMQELPAVYLPSHSGDGEKHLYR